VNNVKNAARKLALDALLQIEEGGAYSNLLLNQILNKNPKLDPRDRHLITEIVYGSIQHQRWIDFQLQPFLKQQLEKLEPWVKQLLRLSIYQFMYLDRVPERAVVHEAVEISKKLGHKGITGMVNGVLRNFLRQPRRELSTIKDPIEQIAIKTSHPTWLVRRWVKQYGLERVEQICLENNLPPKTSIRVNRLRISRTELIEKLESEGYSVEKSSISEDGIVILSGGNISQSELFKQGFFTIQDESSMLVIPLLDPKPGMKVLDVCAAPGGKTTHIAEYMNDEGVIVANDLHPHKEKLILEQKKRLGLNSIETKVGDARKLPFDKESFDRILLDAPCSGFGVIRRKPDIKWKKLEGDITQIAKVQFDLLTHIAPLLKKGGTLVYSTCTIDQEENEALVRKFVSEHPEYRLDENSMRQILPSDFGSDGFFMVRIIKD